MPTPTTLLPHSLLPLPAKLQAHLLSPSMSLFTDWTHLTHTPPPPPLTVQSRHCLLPQPSKLEALLLSRSKVATASFHSLPNCKLTSSHRPCRSLMTGPISHTLLLLLLSPSKVATASFHSLPNCKLTSSHRPKSLFNDWTHLTHTTPPPKKAIRPSLHHPLGRDQLAALHSYRGPGPIPYLALFLTLPLLARALQ